MLFGEGKIGYEENPKKTTKLTRKKGGDRQDDGEELAG